MSITKTKNRLTIKDIAELAGVSKTAVSGILNQKPRVCKAKQQRVLDIIKKYDYVPQVFARTLSMKRTCQIGYLVSSKITLGLANSYFAILQSGVNEACRKRGYYTVVSTYDLSTIENFVMPGKIRQSAVDGLIITGTVVPEVIEQLNKIGIPYIIIGRELSNSMTNALTLDFNFEDNYVNIIDYHYKLGHRNFCLAYTYDIFLKRFMSAVKTSNQYHENDPVNFTYKLLGDIDDNMFTAGEKLARKWLSTPRENRFTTLVANDQSSCGFISELVRGKAATCPEDISIFTPQNTPLSQWNSLPISALDIPLFDKASMATGLLIDLIEKKQTEQQVIEALLTTNDDIYDFIIRKTTGKVPATNNQKL